MNSTRSITLFALATAVLLSTIIGFQQKPALAQSDICGASSIANLMLEDGTVIGNVTVWNTSDYVYVQYNTDGDWRMIQTDLHIARYYSSIPKNDDGSFDVDSFAYHRAYDPPVSTDTYEKSLGTWGAGTELHIAAHAIVAETDLVGGWGSSYDAWGDGPNSYGQGYYLKHVVQECQHIGTQGCTPGYWKQKQHLDSWVGYTPDQLFDDVFGRDTEYDKTLRQSLKGKGGGLKALMRHTTAALLNSAHPDIDYSYTPEQVIAMFQAAFDSGDYEPTKDLFDAANNFGCPLN